MEFLKKHKDGLLAVAMVVGFYCVLFLLGITCPIKFVTGVSCMGCGMTRAWLSVFRLDLHSAVAFHPLFWTVPVAAAAFWLRRRYKRLGNGILAVIIAAFLVVYVVRMLDPDCTVVVFQPQNSLVYRIIRKLG